MIDKEKNCTIVSFFLHALGYIYGVLVFSLNALPPESKYKFFIN
jgi:hypothetical protein